MKVVTVGKPRDLGRAPLPPISETEPRGKGRQHATRAGDENADSWPKDTSDDLSADRLHSDE